MSLRQAHQKIIAELREIASQMRAKGIKQVMDEPALVDIKMSIPDFYGLVSSNGMASLRNLEKHDICFLWSTDWGFTSNYPGPTSGLILQMKQYRFGSKKHGQMEVWQGRKLEWSQADKMDCYESIFFVHPDGEPSEIGPQFQQVTIHS